MSQDADEPLPPRRARPPAQPDPNGRPRPKSKRKPDPSSGRPTDPDQGASTFSPRPGRTTEPGGPAIGASSTFQANPQRAGGKSKSATTREPVPVSGGPGWFERVLFGRVSTTHRAMFCRQFGAYLDAGVDLLKSLDSLRTQFERSAMGPVIGRIAQGVRQGESLTDAMEREPQAFDAQFLAMMTVAEARGGVPETLKMMAASYEAKQRLIRQARSAMIYPIAVLSIAFGVGMLLTIFILPGLVSILEDAIRDKPIDLPLPTRILIGINTFMLKMGWLVLPLGVAGSIFGLFWLYRRPRGKAFLDEILMRLPVLGKLTKMIDTTRFARTLSVLLEAGVNIGDSLALTASTLHLVPFRRAVTGSREAVMEGSELSEALLASHRFSSDVIAIVNSGEETGKLPESLKRLADDYEERVEFMVKNLGSLIQPVIFVFLGGIVLFIALAFFSVYIMLLTGM
ncbi:MAG: type secretory pathway, component PulF [Planctomycetota bacterium]|nr:type secretory pathway, component PulF [Planctomycetota bacterium]